MHFAHMAQGFHAHRRDKNRNGDFCQRLSKRKMEGQKPETVPGWSLLNVANVKMLPIVNSNVANWKLGIGIGNNGNNGNT